jgi:hypothetical protein
MAEGAVSGELSSAEIPAKREKYREICDLNRTASEISANNGVL